MPPSSRSGPNHPAVEQFVRSLNGIPWFTRLGDATERDAGLVRVDFDFLVKHHEDPYAPWGQSLIDAESNIERLVFEHRRLGEFNEVQTAVQRRGPDPHVDDFLTGLVDKYPGYYGDTFSYAHELIELPDRLLWGAAHEVMLADVAPNLNSFQSLMPWFRSGHWPCGWEGGWPEGKLVVW